jgi:hypothetical protein
MRNVWQGRARLVGMILLVSLWLPLAGITATIGEGGGTAQVTSDRPSGLSVTIKENLISLRAEDTPVLEIVKEIGRQMDIEVAGDIAATEKVSLEFEKLTFDEAMERLRVDYVYLTASGAGHNKIMKVTLIPKGEGDGGPMVASQSASVRSVGSASKPEGDVVTEERSQQSAPSKTGNESLPSPEPFKFEFNP